MDRLGDETSTPRQTNGVMPVRIKLSRAKGWRMPANTVCVARPTIWGNAYRVQTWGIERSIAWFRETAIGHWSPSMVEGLPDWQAADVYSAHCGWLERLRKRGYRMPAEAIRMELRGKNLACWCKPGEPCHADVLIEIANA